ncbi:hypothetical protein INR49_025534, partial [Caranx melampygus]
MAATRVKLFAQEEEEEEYISFQTPSWMRSHIQCKSIQRTCLRQTTEMRHDNLSNQGAGWRLNRRPADQEDSNGEGDERTCQRTQHMLRLMRVRSG